MLILNLHSKAFDACKSAYVKFEKLEEYQPLVHFFVIYSTFCSFFRQVQQELQRVKELENIFVINKKKTQKWVLILIIGACV